MSFNSLPAGKNPPHKVNMIVENPTGSMPIKFEVDKEHGMMKVDRFRYGTSAYPYNYGYIPQTLAGDGDPVDVMLVQVASGSHPIPLGVYVEGRPVAVLVMEDDGGMDEKIILVPDDIYHDNIQDLDDLPEMVKARIKDFFDNYKNMEQGKWTKIIGWEGAEKARQLITDGIENEKKANAPDSSPAPVPASPSTPSAA